MLNFFNIRWNKILQKVPATRIMILPQKEIVYKSLHASRQKIPVTGRNLAVTGINLLSQQKNCLSQENIFCHRRQFPVTVTNFLSQEEIFHKKYFSCDIKLIFFPVKQYILPVRGFIPSFAISIHLLCSKSIFLSQE